MLQDIKVIAPMGVILPDGATVRLTVDQSACRRCAPVSGQKGVYRLQGPSQFKIGEVLGLDMALVPKAQVADVVPIQAVPAEVLATEGANT